MKAATPPVFCTSAIACRVRVVFPDASGPKISMTRPRGNPPTPSAISRPSDPVEIAGTSAGASASPSFMIAPFPYCFSIWDRARSNARFLSSFSAMDVPPIKVKVADYTQLQSGNLETNAREDGINGGIQIAGRTGYNTVSDGAICGSVSDFG